MKLKRIAALITAAFVLTVSALPVFADNNSAEKDIEISKEYVFFDQIAEFVSEYYLKSDLSKEDIKLMGISKMLADNEDAVTELLKSTLRSLDPYSDFFTAEEYKNYINQINRTFYGIGITIKKNGQYIEITGFVQKGGTAEKAGFLPGDKIVKVNETNVVGKSIEEVQNLLVGELDTTVNVTVQREAGDVEITAKRVEVSQSTVTGGILEGNIGYINIISFGKNTLNEFNSIINNFHDSGVTKLILDLRDNPGGVVDAATSIAKELVPRGKIITVSYRDQKNNNVEYSTLEKAPYEIIALVNGNTASSSEILASAIQDSGAGVLLGEQTYGKAVIQQLYNIGEGSVIIKLTTGQYLTRNGNEINGVGLEPDFYVKNYTKQIDASPYTQFDFQNRFSIGQNADAVKAAKERLKLLGYYNGETDDTVFDEATKASIKDFQEHAGLAPSGILDVATQVKIKEQFEKLETVVDRQLQTAYEKFGGKAENMYK